MFGGYYFDGGNHYLADTWEWDGSSWAQRSSSGPPPRRFHSMAYDGQIGRGVLFGGQGTSTFINDTWEWDGAVWTQRFSEGQAQRIGHSMVADTASGRVLRFGGNIGAYEADLTQYRGVNLGDMNADGKIDGLDIQPFVTAIANASADPTDVYLADFDSSGNLSPADIDGFVAALLAG